MFGAELQKSHRIVGSRSEARRPNNFDRNPKKYGLRNLWGDNPLIISPVNRIESSKKKFAHIRAQCGYRNFGNRSPTSPQKIQQWGWPVNYPKYFSRKISSYNALHRALLRPKNRASFIKVSYWRNHFKENFVSEKMFATMHLRKKIVSNFRNSGSGIRIRTI